MRNKRPIDALFPKTRRGVLAATYGQPERWWFLSELASQLNTSPSSLQRELQSLVTSGLLRQRRDGKRLYFQAETDSPIFAPLRDLVTQTLGVAAALQDALAAFGDQIRCAFIYGSVARSEEHAQSDVDVIIVGSLGLSDLSSPLRALERKFDREFNVTCYSPQEFRKKGRAGNHFLTSVLKGEKIFLKGDAHDLEELTGEPHGASIHDEHPRNRRVA
ncbi:MAG: hypothetical protein H0W76_08575 [Pyrinomonadaceae bacterium]|nr:hypothetical protein [Pyrinomonadaceae bacterium]